MTFFVSFLFFVALSFWLGGFVPVHQAQTMLQDTGCPWEAQRHGGLALLFVAGETLGGLCCEMNVSRCFLQGALRRYTGGICMMLLVQLATGPSA